MTINNIILGSRSNLTNELLKLSSNFLVIKNSDLLKNKKFLKINTKNKINVIMNNSFPLEKLNSNIERVKFFNNSFITTVNFLESIKTLNINKIIFSSSIAAKLIEKKYFHHNRNLYAFTKYMNEKYINQFCNEYNFKLLICRITNMYGGTEKYTFLNKLTNSYKKKSTFYFDTSNTEYRDFINVSDVAKIYMKLLKNRHTGIIEVGSGNLVQLINLVKIFNKKLKLKKIISNNMDKKKSETNKINKLLKINIKKLNKNYDINKIEDVRNYLTKILNA